MRDGTNVCRCPFFGIDVKLNSTIEDRLKNKCPVNEETCDLIKLGLNPDWRMCEYSRNYPDLIGDMKDELLHVDWLSERKIPFGKWANNILKSNFAYQNQI